MLEKYLKLFKDFYYLSFGNKQERICFYVENGNYWDYFSEIYSSLSKNNLNICYVTSSINDDILYNNTINLRSYFIGTGIIRSTFFLLLKFDYLITTTPDLINIELRYCSIITVPQLSGCDPNTFIQLFKS